MDPLKTVTAIAKRLQLLDPSGKLQKMDSLSIIDFVIELEKAFKRPFPTAQLKDDDFQSLESVAALVQRTAA